MKKITLLASLLLISACRGLLAQTFDPKTDRPSIMVLNGPWKFHTGDSPKPNSIGTSLWTQPSFDDSSWQDYTINPDNPKQTAFEAIQSAQLPGWQQHGHPGYTGYAWYRIRLETLPDTHEFALLMPRFVDEAYDVYVNGRKIGSFGKLDGWRATYPGQPMLFSIPATALNDDRAVTLALRFWDYSNDGLPSGQNLNGGLRGASLLGSSELLRVFQQSVQQQTGQPAWYLILFTAACGAVGIISLFLFLYSRSQREYLWAGISLTSLAIVAAATAVERVQQTSIPFELAYAAAFVAYCVGFFALPLAAMYLLRVPRPLWRRANYAVFAVIATYGLVPLGLALNLLPPTVLIDHINSTTLAPYLPFVFLLLAITFDGLRTLGRKAWLLLTPGLLFALYLILFELFARKGRFVLITESVFVSVPLAVLVVFLLRFVEQQRENVRMTDDLRQAQEVQQVLLPEELPQVSGLTIESEYRPAREVGGDFFQIIPHPADGSILIVVGDVTGKGLQAGMLVALLVGAIRTAAQYDPDPLHVLQALNYRLCGRGHAHATCLALRIASDGAVTLANAGHLPPYLHGTELSMEGALPLGIIEGAEFSMMHFQLAPGDQLTLMTDGVAEAQNDHGQLFGFERIRELLRKSVTAAEVATAAQNFGQEDDISVLSVTRAVAVPLHFHNSTNKNIREKNAG